MLFNFQTFVGYRHNHINLYVMPFLFFRNQEDKAIEMGLGGDGQSNFYKGAIIITLTWATGFACGYKFHKWRMEWLKRRRERLAQKLRDTQDQIDLYSKN